MSAREDEDDDVPVVTFRRRTVIIGGVALAVVVLLVFAAGLLTGIGVVTSNQGKTKPAAKSETSMAQTPAAPPPAPATTAAPPPAPTTRVEPPLETPKPIAAPVMQAEPPSKSTTARANPKPEPKPKTEPKPKATSEAVKPSGTRPAPAAIPAGTPYFTVQTGSFAEEAKATRAAETLRKKGYDAEATQGIDTSGKAWHVVRVGKFTERKAAAAQSTKLKSQENIAGMIVKVGPKS